MTRLGFIILAHQDLDRLAELVNHLVDEDCAVSLHIDKNVSHADFQNFQTLLKSPEQVAFAPRVHCEWGRFSLVQATLNAAQELFAKFDDVSHVGLISGSCLPIRPLRQMKRFLQRNSKTDYIESVSVQNNFWVKDGLNEERFTLFFPFSWRKQRGLFDRWVKVQRRLKIKRKIPEELTPHIGSQWWCLTAKTLKAILNDPKRPYYDSYFSRAWIPDESYFQTLARLHSDDIESRSLTFSKFDYLGRPFLFYDDHLKELAQSDCFFARKIWVGADKLYRVLLDNNRANQPISKAEPKLFEQKFEKAVWVRCEGGEGRFHQGRFPYDRAERTGVSESNFTVFVGFGPLYSDFPQWVHQNTGALTYGSVFARGSVAGTDEDQHFAGNLPASTRVRNRNSKGYLANLLWMNRDQHQTFLYDFRDNPRILGTLAHDPNATVVLVRHAWLIQLLNANRSFKNALVNARRFNILEQRFLAEFAKERACATLHTIGLEHAVHEVSQSLGQAIAHIPGSEQTRLLQIPERENVEGLENFARRLRNNGLNITYEPATRVKPKLLDETVFEKPYVVK